MQNSSGAIHCVCSNYYVVLVVVLARHVDERLQARFLLVVLMEKLGWPPTTHFLKSYVLYEIYLFLSLVAQIGCDDDDDLKCTF